MSVAFFAQGVSHISWSLVAETAPIGLLGVSGGVFNTAGNVASFVIPTVFGIILEITHSFSGSLVFTKEIKCKSTPIMALPAVLTYFWSD
ncbi:MAG: hypothetical protein ACRDRN_05125 [Sciscionella sp.]